MRKKLLFTFPIILPFIIIGCSSQKGELNEALKSTSKRPSVTADRKILPANNKQITEQERLQANADFFRKENQRDILFRQISQKEKAIRLGSNVSVANEKEEQAESFPVFSEILKRDVKNLPSSLWKDTKRVYLDKTNLAILLVAGGASLAVRYGGVDDKWEHHFHRARTLNPEWGDLGGALGNPGIHLGLAALGYYCGIKGGDTKMYRVSKTLFNALIINDVSTVLLKTAACTDSPNDEHYAWPSGHMSSTVCLAAVLDKYYGHKVGIPLYLMSGFVGLERMDDREHFFSDIVFGAALGYVIGKTVADGHSPEVLGGKIVPYVNPYQTSSGIAWVKDF